MNKVISSYEDLEVYQKLVELHLEVHELTMSFPKFEMYELGSQLRRSSNSAPANVAEGWNNPSCRSRTRSRPVWIKLGEDG